MIKTDQLCKQYGPLSAVDNLSFEVRAGEVLGFLGPNGAGKSTTMKMIAGFLSPTSGSASVCGFDVERESIQAKSQIGYLPEGAPSYGEMSPLDFLRFVADIRKLPNAERRNRLDYVIARLHLDEVLYRPIDTLSKGFKRRVGLAQAIIHDPKVLIMDEPTDGLDPNQKQEVRELIQEMAADKIIVISTHILEEVHAVCSRAIIIAHGRILADDTPPALEARSRYHNAVTLRIENQSDAHQGIEALPEVASIEYDSARRLITAFPKNGQIVFPAISKLAYEKQWKIDEIHLESGRLDEVFRRITTEARV